MVIFHSLLYPSFLPLPLCFFPHTQSLPMGSDNHASRRWNYPYPKRFHMANRCWVRLLLLATAACTSVILFKASSGDLRAASYVDVRDICKREVYDVNSTCTDEYCYVIVVTVNMGFYDFFLNWHHYYRRAIPRSNNAYKDDAKNEALLVVIAEDYEIYGELNKLQLNNTQIILGRNEQKSNGDAEDYGSIGYKSLVSGRASHLLNLSCGLQSRTTDQPAIGSRWVVIYSDIDTVWLRDPMPIIKTELFNEQQHFQYDVLAAVDDHDFAGVETYYCTGFLVITSTPASFQFLFRWEEELKANPQLNQPFFNSLLHNDDSHSIQIRHAGLDEIDFPPGRIFFDEDKAKVLEQTVVVHNNYIIGRENKKKRFEEYGIWEP